ncbi:serine/threonine protein phosphatase [Paenibacillus athensensis]|uniref:Serine/threonine protein phosphatase n=1 Tax=Paenibacillus athensensis TaxID=1967502 RepID=A0A4Y8QAU6_9BACL|nr:metallophosphoesterase family protein [Paenibacillus athensensis]MCD1257521.1 serine/threonine protein phosphatase [Paenibacillus athensensis]
MKKKQRTLVISDIHGCLQPFRALLARCGYDPQHDQLILLGDFVDKGPQSKEVVDLVRRMVRQEGVVALRGNHDQRLLDIARSKDTAAVAKFMQHGGKATAQSYLEDDLSNERELSERLPDLRRTLQTDYAEHIAFLQGLPYYFEGPNHIFVHAGLDPAYPDWRRQPVRQFMYIKESFYRHPTHVAKVVVFGHTKTVDLHGKPDIWFGGDKIGVDGGCSSGLQLNALAIGEDGAYDTFAVPANVREQRK